MPVFDYTGRNRRGEAVRGRLEGASPNIVADQLFSNGVTPIDIVAARLGDDATIKTLTLPSSLRAAMVSRLDRLAAMERELLGHCSVQGVEFNVAVTDYIRRTQGHNDTGTVLENLAQESIVHIVFEIGS